jgi:hypothetical protein
VTGNPNLEAETSRNFSTGVDFRARRFGAALSLFRNDVRNLYLNLGRIYTQGFELDAEQSITRQVRPELPEGTGRPFAPAAAVHSGALYVSVSDGALLRLNEAAKSWEKAATATGRVAHRLASHGGSLLVIGGASGGKNFDLIEAVALAH